MLVKLYNCSKWIVQGWRMSHGFRNVSNVFCKNAQMRSNLYQVRNDEQNKMFGESEQSGSYLLREHSIKIMEHKRSTIL